MAKARRFPHDYASEDHRNLHNRDLNSDPSAFDELEDEVIPREAYLDSQDDQRARQLTDQVSYGDFLHAYTPEVKREHEESLSDDELELLQRDTFVRKNKVTFSRTVRNIQVTKSAISNIKSVSREVLPVSIRTMVITQAREFTGKTPDPKTGELNALVALTYTDKETGRRVVQNYSLNEAGHPYLREVVLATCGGDEEMTDALMEDIDWETESREQVMGIEVSVKVGQQLYVRAGVDPKDAEMQNTIGEVKAIERA